MKIYDLTANQLKRAAGIKEEIEQLNAELRSILGSRNQSRSMGTKNRSMSAATKRKIAAAQKARWAKLRRPKSKMQALKTMNNAKKNGKVLTSA